MLSKVAKMEMAITSLSANNLPLFKTNYDTNSKKSFSFSPYTSLFKKPFFGCTPSLCISRETTSFNLNSRIPPQKSIKCSVSQAVETTTGINNSPFLILDFLELSWYFYHPRHISCTFLIVYLIQFHVFFPFLYFSFVFSGLHVQLYKWRIF